jgi:hypothetical protein
VLVANPPPPLPAGAQRDVSSRQAESTLEPIAVRQV